MARKTDLAAKLDNEKLKPVIETINQYGLASHRLVKENAGYVNMAPLEDHQVTYAFKKLLELGVIAPVKSEPVYVQLSGRSEKVYAYTPMGAAVLNEMGYSDAQPLTLDGPLDVSHRCSMALVASQAPGRMEMEKVIPYAPGHNVRADVFATLDDGQIRLLEVEQELTSNNQRRAVDKLKNYAALFATHPPHMMSEVLIVFNLPIDKLSRTLKVWQRALRDAHVSDENIFRYTTLASFMDTGTFGPWDGYERLMPSGNTKEQEGAESHNDPNVHCVRPAEYFEHGREICDEWIMIEDNDAPDRLDAMYDLAFRFYELDFGDGGQTQKFGAAPVNSLGALKQFLHDPRHRSLCEAMKRAVEKYRRATGVTQQIVSANDLASTFLGAFGLSASVMGIRFTTPMTGTYDEARFVILLIKENNSDHEALEWLLGAFIFHARELGLVDEKPKR